jgi:hypothetical protein
LSPSTLPTEPPANLQQLLALRTKYRWQYQDCDARLIYLRSHLSAGSGIEGRFSTLERTLKDSTRSMLAARHEYAAAQQAMEELNQATADRKDTAEVRAAVRSDPIVLELRRRLNEAEIQLAIAGKSGRKKEDLEIERTVLSERLATVRAEVAADEGVSVAGDVARRVERASHEQKRLERLVDRYKQELTDFTNMRASYYAIQESQRRNADQLRAINDQLSELQIRTPQTTPTKLQTGETGYH